MKIKERKLSMCNQFMDKIVAVNEELFFSEVYNTFTNKYLSKEKTLILLLEIGLIEHISGDKYIMSASSSKYKIPFKQEIKELPKRINNKDINSEKLRRQIIYYLKGQPKKRGDISNLINKWIDGSEKRKIQVQIELEYLKSREVIKFYSQEGGIILGHNSNLGCLAEGIVAGLTNKYLDKQWKDRNPILWQISWIIIALIITNIFTYYKGKYKGEEETKKNQINTTKKIEGIQNR